MMLSRLAFSIISATFLTFPCSVIAQEAVTGNRSEGISELKKNVDILAGILREGLDLGGPSNPFGISAGRVKGTYLQGQGVVMEIDSPLARSRTRVGLNALAISIQGLSDQQNPFSVMRRSLNPEAVRTSPLVVDENALEETYRKMLEEVRTIDFDAVIDESIRMANSSARSLREIGEIDPDSFANLRAELDALRMSTNERREELARIENQLVQIYSANNQTPSGVEEADIRDAIARLKTSMEQLKANASERAASLKSQYESAKLLYDEQWRASVSEMEDKLFSLLCDYGATLRNLAEDEYLSVVFSELGEETEGKIGSDKIHVVGKADLSLCQSGEIEAADLQRRSISYSY